MFVRLQIDGRLYPLSVREMPFKQWLGALQR
jgi:hypothetical protein